MISSFIFFFIKLVTFLALSLKDSQKILSCNHYLYRHHDCFLYLNDYIINIEKSNGIRSSKFVVNDFYGLFLHSSVLYIKHSRSFLWHSSLSFCFKGNSTI